ncbi:DNA replication factor C complex subunit Rfc1 [Thecaphora frezii]
MPPKKASAASLPKGQASLSSFFGGGAASAVPKSSSQSASSASPSSKKSGSAVASAKTKDQSAAPSSSPVIEIKDKIILRGSPRKAAAAASSPSAPASLSKSFANKASASTSSTRGSKRSNPVILDDSDDDDEELKPAAPAATRASARSGAKRKNLAEDTDESEDDLQPEPKKRPARSRASRNKIETDSDDDFVELQEKPPPKPRASRGAASAAPTKPAPTKLAPTKSAPTKPAPTKPAPTKPAPTKSAPAAAKKPASAPALADEAEAKPAPTKPSWKEMAARRAAGPSAPGSKEIPQGKPNCLAGLTLVFTGELSSISREEASDLAKRYGARITSAPSSKTSYVVVGEGAGAKKLELIKKNGIPTLDEDGFLDLIATRGAGELDEKAKKKLADEEKKVKETAKAMGTAVCDSSEDLSNALWTTKYAPKSLKDLTGNKAAVDKLQSWLHAWPSSYKSSFKKPGPHGINTFRAVLISGPPGIGKTTSAHLVAKLEGFTPIEFNASDTRSKKLIEEMLKDTVNNKSLDGWYSGGGKMVASNGIKVTDRTVLIMDEVDGMSGGDRGGIGAINALIKKTKVPIICICNDRKNPKMRPFEFTTANLGFRKPDAGAVKSRMLSIAFREKLKIPGEVMAQLIEAAQCDIRSVINMLSTWKLSKDSMDFDEGKRLGLENSKPGMHTPFSLYSELSSPYMFSQTSRKTLNDKADLYFQDHSFAPLMVAENYVKSRPVLATREANDRLRVHKQMDLVRRAAESISDGDMIDRMIHGSEQHWSLMPLHAIASTVRPCSYIYGATEGGFPSFPSWLGMNSKQQRLSRAVVDLQARMRLSCSGSRHDVRQHYLPTMFPMLIEPLVERGSEGISEVIEMMDDYYLGLEDRDAILELGLEPHNAEALTKKIPTAVKAGFTRKYNSTNHPIAFYKGVDVGGKAKQLKAEAAPDLEEVVEEEEVPDDVEVESAASDDDLSKDKLVKRPKVSTAKGKAKAKAKK